MIIQEIRKQFLGPYAEPPCHPKAENNRAKWLFYLVLRVPRKSTGVKTLAVRFLGKSTLPPDCLRELEGPLRLAHDGVIDELAIHLD